jgi:hypothetical protein
MVPLVPTDVPTDTTDTHHYSSMLGTHKCMSTD